jgi:ribosomal protein S18 acetylase RimI-like enzyme
MFSSTIRTLGRQSIIINLRLNSKIRPNNTVDLGEIRSSFGMINHIPSVTLNNISILPPFQGYGLGSQLVDLTERQWLSIYPFQQFSVVAHLTTPDDGSLLNFYQRLGYYADPNQSSNYYDDYSQTFELVRMTKWVSYPSDYKSGVN